MSAERNNLEFCFHCQKDTETHHGDCIECRLSKQERRLKDEKTWAFDRNIIANQIYAVLFPVLAQYETRGYNAHQRTQSIVSNVIAEGDLFVRQNLRGSNAP